MGAIHKNNMEIPEKELQVYYREAYRTIFGFQRDNGLLYDEEKVILTLSMLQCDYKIDYEAACGDVHLQSITWKAEAGGSCELKVSLCYIPK